MKYYKQIGLVACILLVISSFLPWAFYPDLNKSFTGFFSEEDIYGKPGKVFIFFAVVSAILILSNKVWAKRTIIFIAAFNLGYMIRTYILYTSCYRAYCPQKQYGLYLLILSSVLLLAVSFAPNLKVIEETTETTDSADKPGI
ncbi:MAG TPA: hypothetical protein VIJ75_10760 [Hanamia sp.]